VSPLVHSVDSFSLSLSLSLSITIALDFYFDVARKVATTISLMSEVVGCFYLNGGNERVAEITP